MSLVVYSERARDGDQLEDTSSAEEPDQVRDINRITAIRRRSHAVRILDAGSRLGREVCG